MCALRARNPSLRTLKIHKTPPAIITSGTLTVIASYQLPITASLMLSLAIFSSYPNKGRIKLQKGDEGETTNDPFDVVELEYIADGEPVEAASFW